MTDDGGKLYLYDAEGRICAVAATPVAGFTTMTGYLYDADGTRVAKGTITAWSCDPALSGFKTTNDYVLGPSGEQASEMGVGDAATGSSSATALVWQHTNVWADGQLIATYDGSQGAQPGSSTYGLHFYLNDPLGTRRAQTDYAGVLEQTCQSLPFGDALSCTGSTIYPTEHHFTGKERDTESGNDYFGARYYSSAMGRFMSPDFNGPSDDLDPVPYANLENPQTLNLYAYAGNNPLVNQDEDGHFYNGLHCANCHEMTPQMQQEQEAQARRMMYLYMFLSMERYMLWDRHFSKPAAATPTNTPTQAQSTPADPNQNDGKPKLVPNDKHHPNSESPAPKNAQELYDKAIKDSKGRWWAKDADGVIHRFAAESNGETHWNGSTAGSKPIRMEDIPNAIRNSLK